jgi:hypothetical protein
MLKIWSKLYFFTCCVSFFEEYIIIIKLRFIFEFEDIKVVISSRKSKKDRQHNDQKNKDNRTNNVLQNIHIKLKAE